MSLGINWPTLRILVDAQVVLFGIVIFMLAVRAVVPKEKRETLLHRLWH
jgi:hypothetical protein